MAGIATNKASRNNRRKGGGRMGGPGRGQGKGGDDGSGLSPSDKTVASTTGGGGEQGIVVCDWLL